MNDVVVTSGRSITAEFGEFQADHPLYRAHQPRYEVEWAYYQAGSSSEGSEPLICLHGTSGTAGAFFSQVKTLGEKGYRVISAQYPAYGSPEEWCKGFDLFLDALKCDSVHLLGAGLGGFLVQHYASRFSHRVKSMILCNTFATTHPFAEKAGSLASIVYTARLFTPTALLRKVVLDAFPEGPMELSAKQAIDWVASQVDYINGDDLASRLSLNSTASNVGPTVLEQSRITILESDGETMVPEDLRRHLRGVYPGARVAMLKATGDFPYLSKPEEVTLFVEVHMRNAGVFPNGLVVDLDNLPPEAPPSYLGTATPEPVPAAAPSGRVFMDAAAPPVTTQSLEYKEVWKNPFEDDLL